MKETRYPFVIIGGGLAGVSAIKGIRESNTNDPILLLGQERELPYDRPPLTKDLWTGKKKESQILVQNKDFYEHNGVTLQLGCAAVSIDAKNKQIRDQSGTLYGFEKLLIATGGFPRRLTIPGGDLEGICYYRYLSDYQRIRAQLPVQNSFLVIGAGFIGSELAASLSMNGAEVTMIFPEPHICGRLFSETLAVAIEQKFLEHGVRLAGCSRVSAIDRRNGLYVAKLHNGTEIAASNLVVGIGIVPETQLAERAGLQIGNGISVNDQLQTNAPWIYAAGDNTEFPYQALGRRMRVDHWDNALNQGLLAGRNMAGNREPYTYMPYFFSDLYDFGYEAVGDVDPRLEIVADWQKENDTGVIHYIRDHKIVGSMMCNVWGKVDEERQKIIMRQEMAY